MIYWGFLQREALSDDEAIECITSEENVTESNQTALSSRPHTIKQSWHVNLVIQENLKRKPFTKELDVIKDGVMQSIIHL